MSHKFTVYSDGGSRGNPGPAAIGAVIVGPEPLQVLPVKVTGTSAHRLRREYAEYIGIATNNVAEYQAVIFALKKIKQLAGSEDAGKSQIVFYMDSELLVKQLNNEYKVKEETMQKLFMEVHNLKMDFGKVEFKHVLRGKNEDADRLVNQALDREANKLDL